MTSARAPASSGSAGRTANDRRRLGGGSGRARGVRRAARAGADLLCGRPLGARLSALTADGAQVVITDSNRRRVFVNSLVDQNLGPTVGANDSFSADAAILDPFAARGTDDQTVQVLKGARYIRAPYSPGFVQFPEHRPFAAFDGSPSTAWLADPSLDPSQRWIEVGFDSPRDVPFIDLLPYDDSRATVHAVRGRRAPVRGASGLESPRPRAPTRARAAGADRGGGDPHDVPGGAGGLAEIRVPGLHVERGTARAGAGGARARGTRSGSRRAHLPVRAHHGR